MPNDWRMLANVGRWQYFSKRITQVARCHEYVRRTSGGDGWDGSAVTSLQFTYTVRSCRLTPASSAYENNTATNVIATRIDGVGNLVERYCAANMAL
jgi:hypothetical protein